jgi:electron transfer flavoprotein beta subunit
MRIVACIKQVPSAEAQMDPETGVLKRTPVGNILNPNDQYALEAGFKILENCDSGELIALTMGPQSAVEALKAAMAMGASKGILLTSPAFAGADAFATAFTLSQAIKSLGEVDLVVCGLNTTDGDTAQVPFSLAAQLGWPCAGWIKQLEFNPLAFVQEQSGVSVKVIARFPMVIAVGRVAEPRVPSLSAKLAAKRASVGILGPHSLDPACADSYGLQASPTRVRRVYAPTVKQKAMPIEISAAESAWLIAKELGGAS